MKTAAVLIIAIVAQAVGDVCLTRGMKAIAPAETSGGELLDSLSVMALVSSTSAFAQSGAATGAATGAVGGAIVGGFELRAPGDRFRLRFERSCRLLLPG